MKTFISEGVELQVPDISVVVGADGSSPQFRIDEGQFSGIVFSITNIRMDEQDEALMWYDLDTVPEGHVDQIKPIADNFILMILHEQVERSKKDEVLTSST